MNTLSISVDTSSIKLALMNSAYPIMWLWLILCLAYGIDSPDDLKLIAGVKGVGMFVFLFSLELLYPLQKRWGITWEYFFKRDVVLTAANFLFSMLISYSLLLLAIGSANEWQGIMTGQTLWLQVVTGLIAFELLQYSIHRCMHMEVGPVTRFLWRVHSIHHLPQQLYLIMHIVTHPLNVLVIRVAVSLFPIWLLGFDPIAVFVYGSIIGMHGTISHLNFDLRMGIFNYLFVGPQQHRYHHSTKVSEAVNFGAALSIFDQLFGTFRYTPDQHPESLGLSEEDGYPGQTNALQALIFPFMKPKI